MTLPTVRIPHQIGDSLGLGPVCLSIAKFAHSRVPASSRGNQPQWTHLRIGRRVRWRLEGEPNKAHLGGVRSGEWAGPLVGRIHRGCGGIQCSAVVGGGLTARPPHHVTGRRVSPSGLSRGKVK